MKCSNCITCDNCNNCCQCNKEVATASEPPKYVKPPESESSYSEPTKSYNDKWLSLNLLFVGFILGLIVGMFMS